MQAQHIEFLKLLDGSIQYVIPHWQRRYCWGEADIERLVGDLLAIADAGEHSNHYAGNLLTFPEPGAAGVISTIRVVDGQQRLTTTSILLACIATKLERDGSCGDWTAKIIREHRLTNPNMPQKKRYKLRLQGEDHEEYCRGLEGNPGGAGAVTQAWSIARRLVERSDTARLLRGLERLRVVSIGLSPTDDPQQIFESLNATGRPLTVGEKVKNWLLIGLPEDKQRELHEEHWRGIEYALDAEYTSEPIDIFLRDVMRWYTGEMINKDKTYEQLRHWALKNGRTGVTEREDLCKALHRLARLYGFLTGTAGRHPNWRVEAELGHLRRMGVDVHRPFTLRLLSEHEGSEHEATWVSDKDLLKTITGIGIWITRLWLSGQELSGLNKAMTGLAYGAGPAPEENYAEYWLERIRRLRNQNIGVPSDEQVQDGVRIRKAYGGHATRSAHAVLYGLENEYPNQAPDPDCFTVEHVIPQKLTDYWRRYLGKNAEEIHVQYRERLANLTLLGAHDNPSVGADSFAEKKKVYHKSPVSMTRDIAQENEWNEEALLRRAEELAHKALKRWPWIDREASTDGTADESWHKVNPLRWRLGGGEWKTAETGVQMVLDVAGKLLDLDPENADKLSGEAITFDIHPAKRYPTESTKKPNRMRTIPRHDDWVLYPFTRDYPACAERCQKMGERCDVRVEVEIADSISAPGKFWEHFKQWRDSRQAKGEVSELKEGWEIPALKKGWKMNYVLAGPFNTHGDHINIHTTRYSLGLHIQNSEQSVGATKRMHQLSWVIHNQMGDQNPTGDVIQESKNQKTVRVVRSWTREDKDEWDDACWWIWAQYKRLRLILEDADFDDVETNNT